MFKLMTVCLLLLPINAFAYLDPGTGSFVFQMVIASLLGTTYALKSYIRACFSKIQKLLPFGSKKNADSFELSEDIDVSSEQANKQQQNQP